MADPRIPHPSRIAHATTRVFLVLAATAALRAWAQAPVTPKPGEIHAQVACLDFPGQTYALYLPQAYTPTRAWPIVFCFDPAGRGLEPVELLRAAAERHGFILAGSNNSRNGPWLRSHAAADAMLRDTQARFRIDRRLCFAAGFSGGARVACRVAQAGNLAGVIACGAGFSEGSVPETLAFAFFGTAGREDFNYQEMRRTDSILARRGTPHRLVFFDGNHTWMPPHIADHALEWMKVQAMRRGDLARDEAWLRDAYERRLHDASLIAGGEAWAEYTALAADFAGLTDVTTAAARADSLKNARATRRHLAAEKKAAAAEERWLEEFGIALATLESPPPADIDGPMALLNQPAWGRTSGVLPGADDLESDPSAQAGVRSGESRVDAATLALTRDRVDPSAPLRELLRDLRRRARTDIAARRVIASVFAGTMASAQESMEGRDFELAARHLDVAVMIKPDDPRAHFQSAFALAALGHREKAQSSLDAAIAAGYGDRTRVETLARALAKQDATVVDLEPFVVRDLPALESSFGLALIVTADPETRQILRLTVKEVARNSEAEARGLEPGAIIVSADGRNVQTLTARFTRDSDFHRLFMERRPGDSIRLEVIPRTGSAPRVFTLTEGRDATSADRPWLASP